MNLVISSNNYNSLQPTSICSTVWYYTSLQPPILKGAVCSKKIVGVQISKNNNP
jgi:hypothetical protein